MEAKNEFLSELQDIKMKKAKLELQAAEITIKILDTELATKQMEMDSKKKTITTTRRHFAFRKRKIC